jgi:hypothetical protein
VQFHGRIKLGSVKDVICILLSLFPLSPSTLLTTSLCLVENELMNLDKCYSVQCHCQIFPVFPSMIAILVELCFFGCVCLLGILTFVLITNVVDGVLHGTVVAELGIFGM